MTATPLLALTKPTVGADNNTWGGELNADLDIIDSLGSLISGFIFGLTLSTAGASSTFGIAIGSAGASNAVGVMSLASAYTKTTGSWAVGSTNGALDTGTIANATWYHVYLIKRVDTGVVDVLVSTSATAPTMPPSYTLRRRIGAMLTNGSAQWMKFIQTGSFFEWDTPVQDLNAGTSTTAATLYTVTVPTGVTVTAVSTYGFNASGSNQVLLITSPLQSDRVPNVISGDSTIYCSASSILNAPRLAIMTDTSSRIRSRSNTSSALVYIITHGWTDFRGQNS